VLLITYMCPYSLEINFSSSVFLRVVSVWFGSLNMTGIQPDSLERWSVQVERNMSKAVLVPRNT